METFSLRINLVRFLDQPEGSGASSLLSMY